MSALYPTVSFFKSFYPKKWWGAYNKKSHKEAIHSL